VSTGYGNFSGNESSTLLFWTALEQGIFRVAVLYWPPGISEKLITDTKEAPIFCLPTLS
jgi:hypothetical protein